MNLIGYSKFLAWWVSILLLATGVFWAGYFGFIYEIWVSDITYITSIIAAVFILINAFLGWISFKVRDPDYVDSNRELVKNRLETVWFTSEQIMALGMLGTVIGLIHMLAANFIGANGDANMQMLLGDMWKAMGLALYTNAVGLICSIALKVQVYIVGYGLDEKS